MGHGLRHGGAAKVGSDDRADATMITYLKAGWHTRPGRLHLRADVMDGAIDTASMLYRAAVPPEALTRVALQVRGLTPLIHPVVRLTMASGKFSARERFILGRRLRSYTDRHPALQCFLSDCFEHVHTVAELRALYLHIIHVSQMMQLLRLAKVSNRRQRRKSVASGRARKTGPTKRAVAPKAATRKKSAGKKAASKKASAKASPSSKASAKTAKRTSSAGKKRGPLTPRSRLH